MRYLPNHPKLLDQLHIWADGVTLLTASFFFSYRGSSPLDKTIDGLLRSLLFQILKAYPGFAQTIQDAKEHSRIWTPQRLHAALSSVLKQSAAEQVRICFFVDGLDEVEYNSASRDQLSTFIKLISRSWSSRLIAASRPSRPLDAMFAKCPVLRLEDVNSQAIERYIKDILLAKPEVGEILQAEPESLATIIEAFVQRTNGMFLWVHLTMQELFQELDSGASISEILQQLELTPPDLAGLYTRQLLSIPSTYQTSAARITQFIIGFQHADENNIPPTAIQCINVYDEALASRLTTPLFSQTPDWTARIEYLKSIARAYSMLTHLTANLLQISSSSCGPACPFSGIQDARLLRLLEHQNVESSFKAVCRHVLCHTQVHLIHLSVHDYLQSSPEGQKFLGRAFVHPTELREYITQAHQQQSQISNLLSQEVEDEYVDQDNSSTSDRTETDSEIGSAVSGSVFSSTTTLYDLSRFEKLQQPDKQRQSDSGVYSRNYGTIFTESESDQEPSDIEVSVAGVRWRMQKLLGTMMAESDPISDLLASLVDRTSQSTFLLSIRRLLRAYYRTLDSAASDPLEKRTASLFKGKHDRASIARVILLKVRTKDSEETSPWIHVGRSDQETATKIETWLARMLDGASDITFGKVEAVGVEGETDHSKFDYTINSDHHDLNNDFLSDSSSFDVLQMKDFILNDCALQELGFRLRKLLVPARYTSLMREVLSLPADAITFSKGNSSSLVNRAQLFFEMAAEHPWQWWPLKRPEMRVCKNEIRIGWTCVSS